MAAEGDTGFEMHAHQWSYARFLGLFKWGTLVAAIIAAVVVLIISS